MNPDTGEIRKFASVEEAEAAGFVVPLDDRETKWLLHTPAEMRNEHLGLMRLFAGAARMVKGARTGFSRKFFTSARGGFWKPGAEHLPAGGPSRQVRRRAAQRAGTLHKEWPGPGDSAAASVRAEFKAKQTSNVPAPLRGAGT